MKRELQMEESKVDYFLSAKEEFRTIAKQDSRWSFDRPINLVFKNLFTLTSQMYGIRIQSYLAEKLSLTRVNDVDDKGDFRNVKGAYIENKASYLNDTYAFVQLRPYQNLDAYVLTAIDRENDFSPRFFVLTEEQMRYEIEKLASTAHCSKKAAAQNVNIEYRITLNPKTYHWTRWINNYEVDSIECLKRRVRSLIPNERNI